MRSRKTCRKYIIHNEQGVALIVALLMLVVIMAMGIAATNTSIVEGWLSANYRSSKQAFHVAEAGLELMKYYLGNDASVDPSHSWANNTFYFPSGTVTANNSSNYYSINVPGTISVGNKTGTFSIRLKNVGSPFSPNAIVVESTGTVSGATAVVEAQLVFKNYGPWNNAIFAGIGASGRTIKGDVDMRGSVHILGAGLNPTDYAVEMSGSVLVGNNYNGMPESLRVLIPSIGSPESLGTELRVKRGKVGLSGSAKVGQPEVTSANKDTVNGVYVTDGYGGTSGASSIYSDNGTGNAYDLGNDITFPSLNNPYGGYATYADYLTANAYVYSGNLNIGTGTDSFTAVDDRGKGSVIWNKDTATLTVSGLIKVTGDINISNSGTPYTYKGKGTLYVSDPLKKITIKNNLLPSQADGGFPQNAIGFIAAGDLIVGKVAQLQTAGAFYAEGKIISDKQNKILGTFVSNYFDVGSQVPSIYQVPSLAANLPPYMPGSQGYYVVQVRSWRIK